MVVAAGLGWRILQHKSVAPESDVAVSAEQVTDSSVGIPRHASPAVPHAAHRPNSIALQVSDAPAMHLSSELRNIPPSADLPSKPARTESPEIDPASSGPDGTSSQATLAATRGQSRNRTSSLPASVAIPPGSVDKQVKPLSVQQQADNEFRKANVLMQQGRTGEAIAGYESALQLDAGHDAARQAMVGLLLESKRNADAESVLQAGLNYNPKHSGLAMLLARLQVERGALPQALETLQKTLPYVAQQADYQAFIAAVQQRMGQHKEAVAHYQTALQSSPDSGIWLMGLGISLKALQLKDEARVAFKHAMESHTLNSDLQAFVTQQLKEL